MTNPSTFPEEPTREELVAALAQATAEIRRLQELAAANVGGREPAELEASGARPRLLPNKRRRRPWER